MSDEIQLRACRTCMKTKDGMLQDLSVDNLEEKLQFCFDLKVSDVKFGPNFLCNECADVLTKFAEFKQKCLKSEAFWRKTWQPYLNIYSSNVKFDNNASNELEECRNNESPISNEILKSEPVFGDEVEYSNDEMNQLNRFPIKNNLNHKILINSKRKINTERFKTFNKRIKEKKFMGQCSCCKKHYANKKLLISHIKHCSAFIDTIKDKKSTTKQKVKNESSIYYCGLCEKSTDSISTLFSHLENHEKSDHLTCSQCDFKGMDLADFMAHRFEHQPAEMKTFICHKCPLKFRVIVKFEFHYRRAHLLDVAGRCRYCDKTYTNYKMWKYHVKSHSAKPTFECDFCGRVFHIKHILSQHMLTHTGTRKHMCDLCGFSTKKTYDLKCHIQAVHEVRKALPCELCGKLYKNIHGLKHHMRMRHIENKFTCEVCGKCFPSEKVLRSHEIWHSNVRPFRCELCDKAFKSRSNLDEHVRSHSRSKAFCCEVCLKSFTTNRLLRSHQRRNSHFNAVDKKVHSVF